jgi:hypothetical protein
VRGVIFRNFPDFKSSQWDDVGFLDVGLLQGSLLQESSVSNQGLCFELLMGTNMTAHSMLNSKFTIYLQVGFYKTKYPYPLQRASLEFQAVQPLIKLKAFIYIEVTSVTRTSGAKISVTNHLRC